MTLKLLSCEVFYREMCAAVAGSPHRVDAEFLPKGLHDLPADGMRARLQERIDAVPEHDYHAILLGYGLCNNGVHGIRARTTPLVLPRAHDCITLFLGSRKRYMDYFRENPGVYFQTSGWIERGEVEGELRQIAIGHVHGLKMSFDEMVERYGEDNAHYLFETLVEAQRRSYRRYTFIEMGVEPDDRFERQVRGKARGRSWEFEKVCGSMRLIRALVNGEWNEEDFLVVPEPGHRIVARYDEGVVSSGD